MATKKTTTSLSTQEKETPTRIKYYTFAKNCTNKHGRFKKGDKSRGAFAPDLIATYLALGILVDGDN
jgi:hypothetical protein